MMTFCFLKKMNIHVDVPMYCLFGILYTTQNQESLCFQPNPDLSFSILDEITPLLLSHKLRSLNHSVRPPSQSFGEDAPALY